MYRVRLFVRAVLKGESVDLEQTIPLPGPPVVGMLLPEEPGGELCPLLVSEVSRSAGDGTFHCRCEDDLAGMWDDVDELSAAYVAGGWREVRRFRPATVARRAS